MSKFRVVLAVLIVMAVSAPAAQASWLGHHPTWAHRTRAHHVRKHVKRARKTTSTGAPTTAPTVAPTTAPKVINPTPVAPGYVPPVMIADDNACTASNVVAFMQAHGATVLRYVVTEAHIGDGVDCINEARAHGYLIYLSGQYDPTEPVAATVAFFSTLLATYGTPWAMSVGNEERLQDPDGMTVADSAANYLRVWNRVQPSITGAGAHAIVGEADPWAVGWLTDIMDAHPAGAYAASFHCYVTDFGGLGAVPTVAAAAKADGLPLYCSEMAPALSASAPSFFAVQTQASFDANAAAVWAASPNVVARSWYEWPSIGAVTAGM